MKASVYTVGSNAEHEHQGLFRVAGKVKTKFNIFEVRWNGKLGEFCYERMQNIRTQDFGNKNYFAWK